VLCHSPNSLYEQLSRQIYCSARELVNNLVLCHSLGPRSSHHQQKQDFWQWANLDVRVRNEKARRNKCRKPEQSLKLDSIGTYLDQLILTTPQHGGRSQDIVVERPRIILATNRYSCNICSPLFCISSTFHQQPHCTCCVHHIVGATNSCKYVQRPPFFMKRWDQEEQWPNRW
jgi:hypothetical protein